MTQSSAKRRRPGEPRKDCSIEGCATVSYLRTWCRPHYIRWQRYGDPNVVLSPTARMTTAARFAYYTPNRGEGCWEWTGPIHVSGYGQASDGSGGWVQAHRLSYELHRGPIPAGLLVRHSCDNKPCVNPSHLSVGTHADNSRDAVERDRVPRGIGNGNSVLTEDAVREIRRRYAAGGVRMATLAEEFGVSRATVSLLLSRSTWKHIA